MNKTIRFYLIFINAFFISSIIWIVLVYFQLGIQTESSRWIYECTNKKISYADKIQKPKIVVVSGSNALFGINTEMLEEKLETPAVNLAVDAGLELDYILDQSKTIIKPGDTVLLSLEYPLYDENGKPNNTIIDYVFSHDVKYFKKLSLQDKFMYIYGVDSKRLITGLLGIIKPQQKIENAGYQSRTLNLHGDETNNLKSKLTINDIKNLKELEPDKTLIKGIDPMSKSWNILEQYIDWCVDNNVKLFATYPAILENNEYNNKNTINSINDIKEFWKNHNIAILGTYTDFVYGIDWFYDSKYHLNDKGMIKRTEKIIELIKERY